MSATADELTPRGNFVQQLGDFKPGDQIAIKINKPDGTCYYHHGIYLGQEDGPCCATMPSIVDIFEFMLYNPNWPCPGPPMTKSEMVMITYGEGQELPGEETRAKAMEANRSWNFGGKKFDINSHNTEHWATWCKTGVLPTPDGIQKLREAVEQGLKNISGRDGNRIERFYMEQSRK